MISVAMAVYNGEKYISEQIDSILKQLEDKDELVISVNPSTDRTEEIIKQYSAQDSRIKVHLCNMRGVLHNFENAITKTTNDIIMLSDQDDIWADRKIQTVKELFIDKSISGVCHGCQFIDSYGKLLKQQPAETGPHTISTLEILKKNPVQGSTLAFRSDMKKYILPFPSSIPMHDSWIGLMICKHGKLLYIPDQLLLYRQHEGTVTKRQHGTIIRMLFSRIKMAYAYLRY